VGKRKDAIKLLKENYLGSIWYRLNERGGISEYQSDDLRQEYLLNNQLKTICFLFYGVLR